MKKKILFTILFALLISIMIPTVVHAAIIDVGAGDSPYDLSTVPVGDNIRILQDEVVTITGTAPINTMVTCLSGVTLTLDNVDISCNTDFTYALGFNGTGNTLILSGTNNVSSGYFVAGVWVGEAVELTIKEDEATGGTLNTNGGGAGAGIGGVNNFDGGIITIESGTINAVGGHFASGIGGGHSGNGGVITINGGTITAKSAGAGGAGIGGGFSGSSGTITITGGTVYADGDTSNNAQDIGVGQTGPASDTLTISGDARVFVANESVMNAQAPLPQYTVINNAGAMPAGYTMPMGTVFPVGMLQAAPAPEPASDPTPTTPIVSAPEKVENPQTGYYDCDTYRLIIIPKLLS